MILCDKTLNYMKIRTMRLHLSAPVLTRNTAFEASLSSHCTSQTTEEHLFYPIFTLPVHNYPEDTNYQSADNFPGDQIFPGVKGSLAALRDI